MGRANLSTGSRVKSSGFTLIEIMVVMVILGLLVAIVAPNVLNQGDKARVGTVKAQLRNIGNALDLYKLDNYNYPSTEQGLEALVTKPSGFPEPKNWNKDGYLPSVPKDAWDNPYQYFAPGSSGPFDLYSYGADGKEGGEGDAADITFNNLD
ncbi:MAG: type II secretion system major pseudopilin GspG [Pseudomonadales bacterium]|nr:type II secretion system major pseudopilin GspG [Pseudomonadales bacterium]